MGTAGWPADGLVNGRRFAPVGGRGSHSVCWAHNQSEVEVDQWADAQHHHWQRGAGVINRHELVELSAGVCEN